MTRLRLAAFALCAFAAATAAVADDTPAMKMDATKLVGSYKLVGGMTAGKEMKEEAKKAPVTITKDKITMKGDQMTFVFSYKLDADAKPVTIDMETLEPDAVKGSKSKGIIKMDGNKVTIAYDPQGMKTPMDFKSTEKNGIFMFEMEKAEMKKGKGKGKKKKDN